MSDFVHSKDIPKKYYRYFLKGLAYYTCHLNKACTLADLQAYVFLKSLQQLSAADLTSLSNEVMRKLVSAGIANNQNGYYRLHELLRFAHGSSSKQVETIDQNRDLELSSGSGLRKMVNFSNTVTMWPTDTLDGVDTMPGAVVSPTEFLSVSTSTIQEDIESSINETDADNQSDSDHDDEDNDGEKAETNQNASQGETSPETKHDSDSNRTTNSDDEDSTIPHKPMKQEPDKEPNNPESEDDTQKEQ
ncbi:clumping factor A-like [Anopheles moucheti]|uniref:clumping factor A-like n=1 Tax=Anopheles moucheti TaxID=186751 RepID=UPI0022F0D616|nr:clumping factor A-like [Anopheles moucheti]